MPLWVYLVGAPYIAFEGDNQPPYQRLADAVKAPLYGCDCYAYGLLASGFCDLVVEAGKPAPVPPTQHTPVQSTCST